MTLRQIFLPGGGVAGVVLSVTQATTRVLSRLSLGVGVTGRFGGRSVPLVRSGVRAATRARVSGSALATMGGEITRIRYALVDATPQSLIDDTQSQGGSWAGGSSAAGLYDGSSTSHSGSATAAHDTYIVARRPSNYGPNKSALTLTKVEVLVVLQGGMQGLGDSTQIYLGSTLTNQFRVLLLDRQGVQVGYPAATVLAYDVGPGSGYGADALDTWAKVQASLVTLRHYTALGSATNTLTVDYVGLRINGELIQNV